MSRDVFVSLASDDQAPVMQVCELLEQRGLACWIAPRNVSVGDPYLKLASGGGKDEALLVTDRFKFPSSWTSGSCARMAANGRARRRQRPSRSRVRASSQAH